MDAGAAAQTAAQSAASLAAELPADIREYGESGGGRIQAQVSSFKDGLQIYKGVNIVRVRGKQARLLIMEDYLPVIGEVDGDIDFIGRGFFHTLRSVHGFFCHEHNVFFLLLREERKKPGSAADAAATAAAGSTAAATETESAPN
jgi:hypothetical protein